MFMNTAADASLVDFDLEMVRTFRLLTDHVLFEPDHRDDFLAREVAAANPDYVAPSPNRSGRKLTPDLIRHMAARGESLNFTFR